MGDAPPEKVVDPAPLLLAASLGHVDTCKKLVEGGIPVDGISEKVRHRPAHPPAHSPDALWG